MDEGLDGIVRFHPSPFIVLASNTLPWSKYARDYADGLICGDASSLGSTRVSAWCTVRDSGRCVPTLTFRSFGVVSYSVGPVSASCVVIAIIFLTFVKPTICFYWWMHESRAGHGFSPSFTRSFFPFYATFFERHMPDPCASYAFFLRRQYWFPAVTGGCSLTSFITFSVPLGLLIRRS